MENHEHDYKPHEQSPEHKLSEHGDHYKNKKKLLKNPWQVSTMVLGIVTIVLLFLSFSGGISGKVTGNVISSEEAGEKIIEFANAQGADAELVKVNDDGSFYEVVLSMQGQEVPLYVTKDGKSFTQALIPLTEDVASNNQNQQGQAQGPIDYTADDLVKIKEFSQCLADNGVKAYGAGWCGYCKQFKEAFGGMEQITSFYYECQNADRTPTENAALCEQEQITGFPTIKINGKPYSGARTIEGLASVVEACNVPELSNGGVAQQTQTQQAQGSTTYTEEEVAKIGVFMNCLADKGVKIYGANWCGWTKKFVVETIGGFDIAEPVYVECTENTEECSDAGVSGYPTTQINGEAYSGSRDFAGLAAVTGCKAPDVEGLVQASATTNTEAGCGV